MPDFQYILQQHHCSVTLCCMKGPAPNSVCTSACINMSLPVCPPAAQQCWKTRLQVLRSQQEYIYPSWNILKGFLVYLLFEGCVGKSWEAEVCLEEWHLWWEWACHATVGIWIGLLFSSVALDNIDEGFISICEVFALWPGSLQVVENAGGEAAV